MQPKNKKIALIIGALFLGASGASQADVFPVTAGAIPDVEADMVAGYTEVSFGTGVIGNKVGEVCAMNGITGIADAELLWDADGGDDNTVEASTYGALSGDACISGGTGVPMVIEIDAADTSTVTVTVADVVGAGYTYTPTAESCVIDFDRTNVADTCVSLAGNTVTGIGMSLTVADGASVATEDTAGVFGFAAISGKTRMVLGGQITIDSEIAAGTDIADTLTVQVTYE